MAAEIVLIGSIATFFTAVAINEWKSSRCSSKEAWFHNWKQDDSCVETTQHYTIGSHSYTATWKMFECEYCRERRNIRISTTEPESDIGE